ncbi:hypothetical protein [Sphingomonas antarctica]|uniref:hypothetical protein n=1 Tax=Sphingomonas antarctica TaxID=2040274 RepID=UPI0039EA7B95
MSLSLSLSSRLDCSIALPAKIASALEFGTGCLNLGRCLSLRLRRGLCTLLAFATIAMLTAFGLRLHPTITVFTALRHCRDRGRRREQAGHYDHLSHRHVLKAVPRDCGSLMTIRFAQMI